MGVKGNGKNRGKGFFYVLKKNKFLLIIFLLSLSYALLKTGNTFRPIEEMEVPSAIGFDIIKRQDGYIYSVPVSFYTYIGQEVGTFTISGEAGTIPESREKRQTKARGKFIIGLEKVIIISEEAASHGINNILDVFFSERTVNDTAFVVVCKGTAKDMLDLNVYGVPGVGDYLSDLIKHLINLNFMPNNYRLIDTFVRVDTRGRSLVIPYVEIQNDKPKVTGLAMFSKGQMKGKVGLEEAKTLNLLRESGVWGLITIKKDFDHYANFYGISKRKVKSYMKDGKLTFDITLNFEGELITNSLYENTAEHPEVLKEVEKNLKGVVEEDCKKFIESMQAKYMVDCLELGRYGISVLGHDAVTDLDKEISESQINVTANVKITEIGRGDF